MSLVNTEAPPRALAPEPSLHRSRDEGDGAMREAEEAEAAGHKELAAERYVEAANHIAKIGGYDRAVALAERALRLLDDATAAASHRSVRIAALMTLGRTKWLAAGNDGHEHWLPSALAALESASSLLIARDHVELRAELAQLTARVYADIGGEKQLSTAVALLVWARRALRGAGLALEAALLLNDEAAVRARRGELEHARRLLQRSQRTFARFVDASPVARRELARTERLMARLARHAGTRIDSASR